MLEILEHKKNNKLIAYYLSFYFSLKKIQILCEITTLVMGLKLNKMIII